MIIFLTTITQYLIDIIHNGFIDDKTIFLQCYHSKGQIWQSELQQKDLSCVYKQNPDQNRTISSNQFTKVELNSTP